MRSCFGPLAGLDKSWEKYNILFSDFIKEAIWVKRSETVYPLLDARTNYVEGDDRREESKAVGGFTWVTSFLISNKEKM